MPKLLIAPHPGTLFQDVVLKPLSMSTAEAARQLNVPRETLRDFIHGKTSLDAVLAHKIGAFSGIGPSAWMFAQARFSLQESYDSPEVVAEVTRLRESWGGRMVNLKSRVLESLFPSGAPKVFNYFYRRSI